MARYIDADSFKRKLIDEKSFFPCIVAKALEEIPIADVAEVKHGEWIEKDCITESNRGRIIHYVTNKCSVCGKWNGRHKSNYCPYCGVKMDGGQTE